MRTGSCSVQQGLTAEAASIVKQAVTLAKRRGHAQVTPLHVANTMLAVTNGLLRTACLQSHSHPLQCKALELCFNVALNRLPASTSSPMLGSHNHHHHHSPCPSISNALVAAFKRAQAHQRRGSIENQQQPLLAVKIELEQLIISILDDPSVSRVMREAGFCSTQVKSNVEQAVSLEICSQNNSNTTATKPSKENGQKDFIRNDDVTSVIDSLTNQRKKSLVIVGECLDSLEGVVRGVMEKVDKGEVGESLKGVKFVSLTLSSFGGFSKVEVEQKVEELKRLTKSNNGSHGKGYVLYLGDLNFVTENYLAREQQGREFYSPVDHMVMEIGKLIVGTENNNNNNNNNNERFWVMGIATFQAYTRCKNGCPSLETLWCLHPITIPAGNLRLSLITDSGDVQQNEANNKADKRRSWLLLEGDQKEQAACFTEPSVNMKINIESEVGRSTLLNSNASNYTDSSTSSLPAWLQQYKNDQNNKGIHAFSDQNCVPVGELCKKWNSMGSNSIQNQSNLCNKTLSLSSVSPSSSTSGFSCDHQHLNLSQPSQPVAEPTLRSYISEKSSSNPNSASSSDIMEVEYVSKFKELNSENLKTMCNALEKKVPWQKDIIPEIASTILQCRCGMVRRKGKIRNIAKEETWLFFQGVDLEAKEKLARELARLVFGSQNNFISIGLSSFASTRADSSEDCRNYKRTRDNCCCIERFGDAISSNPHRVFFVEDIEQVDYCSQLGFKRAIERGRVRDSNGEEVSVCDAIIILSCESFSSRSRACSPSVKQKENNDIATLEETSPCGSLDLNISICDDYDEDQSVDNDIGLLESVDRKIVLKNIQEL